MSFIKFISYISSFYQLLWVFILWTPFIYTIYKTGTLNHLYDQLTWWSWTLQCVFYTYMHLKQSICYRKIRLILAKFCCNKQLSKDYKNISAPVEMYIFGMVIGITWYVFLQFMYVLYYNPTLVHDESMNYTNKGLPQIGNIFIHYYIVAATPLWTIFNFRYIHYRVKNFNIKESIIFSVMWILYIFLYLCYWQFDVHGIFKNYHIDDISLSNNLLYSLLIMIIVSFANLVYLFSIKKDLTKVDELLSHKVDRKIYITNDSDVNDTKEIDNKKENNSKEENGNTIEL